MGVETFLGKVVAEYVFVEVAHRVHLEYHRLRVNEDMGAVVVGFGRFIVCKEGIDNGLLSCGELV